jgi:2-polyprenyl-6-methoxyphenol hydroxylase-like FAD-dependent oxidoreductase
VNLDLSRIGSRYGCMLGIPQDETEALLRRRVVELGGRIEQAVELLSLCEHDGVVTATVKDGAGQTHTITSSYLVGCDGAHSRVRHELGLSFHGHPYAEDWLLADVRMDWDRREDEFHAFFRAHGSPMVCLPLRDHGWRIILPYAGERGQDAPTFDEVQRLVDERAPQPVALSDPTWLTTFRCHRRSTNVYRVGSVLLAGDAVHIHTPAGGQGMNTGILDAHNLAWKLALVADGQAPADLLDTYAEERGPVAASVLGLTHALVQVATTQQPLQRALRDALLPVVSRLPVVQRRAVRRLSQVHVTYRHSSLTRHAGARPAALRPGDRAPDVCVVVPGAGPRRLYEALRAGRHLLLVPDAAAAHALRAFGDLFDVVHGDLGRSMWLIRPDGYLAATGERAITAYLRACYRSIGDTRVRWR